MRTLLVLSAMLISGSGCAAPAPSSELLGSSSPSERATTTSRRDAGASTVQPVVVEEGDATAVTPVPSGSGNWQGHVATTTAVDFGGGVFCAYRVVLSDIDVTLTLDQQGRITASRIQSTMTETTPSSCQAAPLGVQENDYAFDASTSTPAVLLTASLAPDAKNLPLANVTINAALVDVQNMRASIVFQRTGGTAASLDWKVTTEVQLTKH